MTNDGKIDWLSIVGAVLLAWTFALGLGMLLGACGGHVNALGETDAVGSEYSSPIVAAEYDRAALVRMTCAVEDPSMGALVKTIDYGSGVLVSDHQLITAAHVVHCDGGWWITARVLGDDRDVPVRVEYADDTGDVARLAALQGTPWSAPPVRAGSADVGAVVCALDVWPDVQRRCGEVQLPSPTPGAELEFTGMAEPGNSGAGVYNDNGDLVGVVTRMVPCFDGEICDTRAAVLGPTVLP